MGKLACLGKHGVGNLAQRVESLDDGLKHYGHMLVGIKVLHVAFSVMFAAEFENFFLAEPIY